VKKEQDVAVHIRMKRLGRTGRPFYRVCALDARVQRDGKVIEELGYYDPMVKDTDARAILNGERIEYWLGVGAKPSEKVRVLIKKYGKNGTHLEKQKAALERIAASRPRPSAAAAMRPEAAQPEQPAESQESSSEGRDE
jgi:small subunit ribosomal protein S16